MTRLDFAIRRYCRRVRSYLPCSRKEKQEFLTDLEKQLRRYAADHPGCTAADLRAHFGKPRQIAVSYLEDMELPQVLKALNVRRRIAGVILAGAAVAFTMWSAYYLYFHFFPQDNEDIPTYYITQDEVHLPGEEAAP